jgi:hypothetical protein
MNTELKRSCGDKGGGLALGSKDGPSRGRITGKEEEFLLEGVELLRVLGTRKIEILEEGSILLLNSRNGTLSGARVFGPVETST